MPRHHELSRIIDRHLFSGYMPGYCTNPGCTHTHMVDLETTNGFCPMCHTKTVTSALVLQ